jgi:hypothetical protein
VVLPYIPSLSISTGSISKRKKVRSFLAFPYGVLTIASYVNRFSFNSASTWRNR